MPLDLKPNQDFLKFIAIQGEKKNFQNLETLLNLERNYPGMFVKVMYDFENAKSYRECLNDRGMPITVPWEDALKKFFLNNKYTGITNENRDIAELFGSKGLSQEVFDKANILREEAQGNNIPEHILDKTIKEETILESIERIKSQTNEELINGKELIEELYDKKFTYEWLSKKDPSNSIMGLFCSCCGTITSCAYGKNIAKSSVIAPDVQNIVVRNSEGKIISKGTMYVNKEKGYAVINDFELNEKYRKNERDSGRYTSPENSPEEKDRELIFKSFQRGLGAFITEYDKQNPEKPLKQINIGMGYNRLKKQVERFKKATSNLTVPAEYQFMDASTQQYILYQREEELDKKLEDGGYER